MALFHPAVRLNLSRVFEVTVRSSFLFSPPDVSSTVYFLAGNLKEGVSFPFLLSFSPLTIRRIKCLEYRNNKREKL